MSDTDTQPDTNQTVSELVTEVHQLRAELAARAADETGKLVADLKLIAESMKHEAHYRGWCSDYEYWVRHTNPKLSQPWLIPRNFDNEGYCDICKGRHP